MLLAEVSLICFHPVAQEMNCIWSAWNSKNYAHIYQSCPTCINLPLQFLENTDKHCLGDKKGTKKKKRNEFTREFTVSAGHTNEPSFFPQLNLRCYQHNQFILRLSTQYINFLLCLKCLYQIR